MVQLFGILTLMWTFVVHVECRRQRHTMHTSAMCTCAFRSAYVDALHISGRICLPEVISRQNCCWNRKMIKMHFTGSQTQCILCCPPTLTPSMRRGVYVQWALECITPQVLPPPPLLLSSSFSSLSNRATNRNMAWRRRCCKRFWHNIYLNKSWIRNCFNTEHRDVAECACAICRDLLSPPFSSSGTRFRAYHTWVWVVTLYSVLSFIMEWKPRCKCTQ